MLDRKQPLRRPGRRVIAILIAAVLVSGLGAGAAHATARGSDLNLLFMLRRIYRANQEIGHLNAEILSALGGVRQQMESVDRIRNSMRRMEGLVGRQEALLERLEHQTKAQARLSREMAALTEALGEPVAGMARTAKREAEVLQAMSDKTSALSGRMSSISRSNRSIAKKLDRAEELSGLVLSRMP